MDFLTIAPAAPTKVDVEGGSVEVRGIGLRDAANLLRRFPLLLDLFSDQPTTVGGLIQSAPDACAAIFAIGAGKGGDAAVEAVFDQLSLESQLDVLEAIVKRTVPKGWAPFFEKLSVLWSSPARPPAGSPEAAAIERDLGGMPQSYVEPPSSS